MKHLKKIKKETIKKGLTTLVIVFFAMVMFFQKDIPNTEIKFVRNTDEAFVHNVTNQQREYLFQDEGGQPVYQGTLGTGIATNTVSGSSREALIHPGEIYSGTRDTGTNLNCITPRGEPVQNNDFVLGYEQRVDVNTICNVQKRICTNGTLGGTFMQKSCKENIVYTYKKAPVISYNQKVLNEYIQATAPIHIGAEFDNQGKINTQEQATSNRGTTNSPVVTTTKVSQSPLPSKASCTTPRGQKVKHGQFIKAYKSPRGFIDLPCDTEIRACVHGALKGSFTHAKCMYNNTTYADYLKAGAPASNIGFFFQRIQSVFK